MSTEGPWHWLVVNGLPVGATPLTAALWLARHHTDYLLGVEGPPDFLRWRGSLEPVEVERVLAVGSALVRIWVAAARAELGPIDEREPGAWLERASALVLRHVLRAFDVGFESERQLYPWMAGEYYFEGSGSRLMRGLANCDVYSHLLALVLRGSTRAEVIGVNGHRVVRVPGFLPRWRLVPRLLGLFGTTVYVDGYTELPPFVLEQHPAGLTTFDELQVLAAERDRRYRELGQPPGEPLRPARVYAEARAIRMARERASKWPAALDPDLSVDSASRELVGIYFDARAHHLFGSPEHAAALYGSIASTDGDRPGWIGTMRSAARLFADRLT